MKKLLLLCLLVLLAACGGVKKTQEALNTGNYEVAINRAIKNLAENKTKKGHQDFILLLEEAFHKNTVRELAQISFLEKDGNPANLEAIYTGYVRLKGIQERIKPLLPLRIHEANRNAVFGFQDFDTAILKAKDGLSEYLYANASNLLKSANNKLEYRQAYDDLKYLAAHLRKSAGAAFAHLLTLKRRQFVRRRRITTSTDAISAP
ncbi:MAG: hypothetical protein AAGB24_15985, partial [Bacteroidota bacterium]